MSIERQLEALVGPEPAGLSESVALGTGLVDGYDIYDSPVGTVAIAFNPIGVSSVDLTDGFEDRFRERFDRPLVRAEAPQAWGNRIDEALERGTPGKLPIDYRSVTPFQRDVLTKTASIPHGEVRPYGWVAKEVDRPKAVRAVGSAVARNPVPLIIPCHRVVRSDGHVGNYSLGGPENKHSLLRLEGADPEWLENLASAHVRVRANKSTGIFCHPTCRAIRRSKESNVVDFRSAEQAGQDGYRACRLCRPTG